MNTEIIDKLFLELSQFTTETHPDSRDAAIAMDRTHKAISAAGVKENGPPWDRVKILADERDRWKQSHLDVLDELQRTQEENESLRRGGISAEADYIQCVNGAEELRKHRNKLIDAARKAQELLKMGYAYEALERAIKNE